MSCIQEDSAIIEQVKDGDTIAFRKLVEQYKDEATTLACSIVKDQSLAEDVVQEVFIKVFDKIRSYKYQSAFSTWLYRIVVNRCYNELRKRTITTDQFEEAVSKREEAAAVVHAHDLKQIVQLVLHQMKPDEALVLRLFYLSELRIPEVVEVTGFSKSKVKVTLHRGRNSFSNILKKRLGKEIEDL